MLDLIHKQHKYIAKQKTGNKTRYFYTQEELAAYKRALSSQDEAKKFNKATGADKAKSPIPGYEVHQLATSYARTALAKENGSPEYNKMKKTQDDYERAKTLKGKAEDVKKVNAQVKERRAEEKAVRKEEKAAKKADRKAEINDYKKALSSKDESAAYEKSNKKLDNAFEKEKKVKSENAYDANARLLGKKKKEAQAENEKVEAERKKAQAERDKARDDFERAETIKGKSEDLKEAFNKHHPDTVKRVNKAKKKIKKYLGN